MCLCVCVTEREKDGRERERERERKRERESNICVRNANQVGSYPGNRRHKFTNDSIRQRERPSPTEAVFAHIE